MNKRTHIILLTACLCLTAQAQLLYEVSGNGLKNKSYLFAQHPTVNATFLDSISDLLYYYGKTNALVLESHIKRVDDQKALVEACRIDTGFYHKAFSNEEFQIVNQAMFNQLHLTSDTWLHIHPAMLVSSLREKLLTDSLKSYDPEQSMENLFYLFAMEQEHPIYGLDDLSQITHIMFKREPIDYAANELLKILHYPERELQVERTLIKNYRQGDLTTMAYTLKGPQNHSTLSYSDYAQYAKRNQRWVKELRDILSKQSSFIMLDAIYLGGEDGLIAQLRKAGYKVRPAKLRKASRK